MEKESKTIWRCLDCGAQFAHPAELSAEEYGEDLKKKNIELLHFKCCPVCRSRDVVSGEPCIICGKRQARDGGQLCHHCDTFFSDWAEAVADLAEKTFDISYRDYVDLHAEWLSKHW